MKNKTNIKNLVVVGLLLLFVQNQLVAQKIKSPKMVAKGENATVTYGQPSKCGRVIFGDLVPYGEVWRTGANEATEITFLKNVMINGTEIKAGTYTLFSIPQKDKWTLILNSELGQWGTSDYDKTKSKDIFKTDVVVKKIKSVEELTYTFKEDNATGTILSIAWDDVEVELAISYK